VPLSKGGTNDIDNIVPSCYCCNGQKRDMMPLEFAAKISKHSNPTTTYQEAVRIEALLLVERLAKQTRMHLAIGLPEQKRRSA